MDSYTTVRLLCALMIAVSMALTGFAIWKACRDSPFSTSQRIARDVVIICLLALYTGVWVALFLDEVFYK